MVALWERIDGLNDQKTDLKRYLPEFQIESGMTPLTGGAHVRLMLSVSAHRRKCIEAWSRRSRPSIRFAAANHSGLADPWSE